MLAETKVSPGLRRVPGDGEHGEPAGGDRVDDGFHSRIEASVVHPLLATYPKLDCKQIGLLQRKPQTHRTTRQGRKIGAPGPPDGLLDGITDLVAAIRQRKAGEPLAIGVLDLHPQTAASAGRLVNGQFPAGELQGLGDHLGQVGAGVN
jgi:hypothetical protein